jgi:hypothetical protein
MQNARADSDDSRLKEPYEICQSVFRHIDPVALLSLAGKDYALILIFFTILINGSNLRSTFLEDVAVEAFFLLQ